MRILCIVLFPGSCRAAESTAVGPAAAGWCATGSGCPRPGAGSSCRPGSGSGPSGSSCDRICHRAQHSSSGETALVHLYTHFRHMGTYFSAKSMSQSVRKTDSWILQNGLLVFGVVMPFQCCWWWHNMHTHLCFTLVIRNSNSCSTRK